MSPTSRHSEDPVPSDVDPPAHTPQKPPSHTATPTANTPEPTTTRSSDSSREATEADRREARQLLSQEGALRKTGWLLLRSTGPNLTAVLRHAGATGLSVRQLYHFRLDRDWRVHCFILLYKWSPDRGDRVQWNPERVPPTVATPPAMEDDSGAAAAEGIMLCRHTMDNASATQALIMAALNIADNAGPDHHLTRTGGADAVAHTHDIGDRLRVLKGFVQPLDPVLRAAALCSAEVVRNAHNEAARNQLGGHPELLDEDGKVRSTLLAEELWMYSVYIPGRDRRYIYELESMADEANVVAACGEDERESWAPLMRKPIMERVSTFREHNTPFLLFAVTSDVKPTALSRIPRKGRSVESENDTQAWKHEKEDGEIGDMHEKQDGEEDTGDSDDEYDEEAAKEEVARIRATHNYDTFFVEMMKLMASRGDINAIIRDDDMVGATSSEEEE